MWLDQRGTWDQCPLLREKGAAYLERLRATVSDDIPLATGLYISGPVGCGKTFLADCILKKMEGVTRIRAIDLPRMYRESESEFIQVVRNNRGPIMVDDVGCETKCSYWGSHIEVFAELIALRAEIPAAMIMTSNLPLKHLDPKVDTIAKRYGDRIASRIGGMCWVVNVNGIDRRPEAKGKL